MVLCLIYDQFFKEQIPTAADEEATDEESATFTCSLFPNPTHDVMYVTSSVDAQMTVVSLAGNLIANEEINQGVNSFNMSNLNKGVYIVNISNNGTSKVLKVIVK